MLWLFFAKILLPAKILRSISMDFSLQAVYNKMCRSMYLKLFLLP